MVGRFSFSSNCIFRTKFDVVWFGGHSTLKDQQSALGQNIWRDILAYGRMSQGIFYGGGGGGIPHYTGKPFGVILLV